METEKKKENFPALSMAEVSSFCLQTSVILAAGISPASGLSAMAEDAVGEEKKLLDFMENIMDEGGTFYEAVKAAGCFPNYMVIMTKIGEETGTVEEVMSSLSDYYEKEQALQASIKSALTYPAAMAMMMLFVLFILMTKVMPVFQDVFRVMGAEMSPFVVSMMSAGGWLSGGALVILIILGIFALIVYFLSKRNIRLAPVEAFLSFIKRNSKISGLTARRRFADVMAMIIRSGGNIAEGISLAGQVSENSSISEKAEKCRSMVEEGESFGEALKVTELFTGLSLQMLQVAQRAGRTDTMLEKIAVRYEEEADRRMSSMLARLEPGMVAVLSIAAGSLLLSVMLPLMGMMSSIG